MGLLYEKTDTGELLRKVTPELGKSILDNYYWKHHNEFTRMVEQGLQQYGKVVIVDCHSFPHKSLKRALDQSNFRPDFNIGTDTFHTPPNLIDASIRFFKEKGYSLGVDKPYSGAIVPLQYYKKDKNVQSIMLEVNRGLYLKEPTNDKNKEYSDIKLVV